MMRRRTLYLILSMVLVIATGNPATDGARAGTPRRVVIVAAGDIGKEDAPSPDQELTAALIRMIQPTAVVAIGDTQYPRGEYQQYLSSYDLNWGRFKRRTHPVPGNHEYMTPGARGYFRYFGRRAHGPEGWYSFDLGKWHIVALNSRLGQRPAGRQVRWLARDLQDDRHRCELAFYHWKTLSKHGVDVVLNAHQHNYERFAPMGARGGLDPKGIVEFVVGTGGRNTNGFVDPPLATSRVQLVAFGVLKLTLRSRGFTWQFIKTDETVADEGRRGCHA